MRVQSRSGAFGQGRRPARAHASRAQPAVPVIRPMNEKKVMTCAEVYAVLLVTGTMSFQCR